jgi:hypothetical protein
MPSHRYSRVKGPAGRVEHEVPLVTACNAATHATSHGAKKKAQTKAKATAKKKKGKVGGEGEEEGIDFSRFVLVVIVWDKPQREARVAQVDVKSDGGSDGGGDFGGGAGVHTYTVAVESDGASRSATERSAGTQYGSFAAALVGRIGNGVEEEEEEEEGESRLMVVGGGVAGVRLPA